MTRLFEHLLKLKYWEAGRDHNHNYWKKEILNFRLQINKELKVSLSLKNYLKEIFRECYENSRKLVAIKFQLPLNTFLKSPIASIEQILDKQWLP